MSIMKLAVYNQTAIVLLTNALEILCLHQCYLTNCMKYDSLVVHMIILFDSVYLKNCKVGYVSKQHGIHSQYALLLAAACIEYH